MRPGELPDNEVRSVRSAPLPNAGAHLLERIPLWTMSTRIYVASLAHVTAARRGEFTSPKSIVSLRFSGKRLSESLRNLRTKTSNTICVFKLKERTLTRKISPFVSKIYYGLSISRY